MHPQRLTVSNCLLWARAMRRRLRRIDPRTGHPRWGPHWRVYYGLRDSDWGWWQHRVLVIEHTLVGSVHVVHFGPPKGGRQKWLPPPLFSGQVHWGDKPPSTAAAAAGARWRQAR